MKFIKNFVCVIVIVWLIGFLFFVFLNEDTDNNTKQQIKEETIKNPITNQQPKYKLMEDIELTELYKYPEFGFYIFKINRMPEFIPALLENLIIAFDFGTSEQQTVYIFDRMPDLSKVLKAPKQLPANLIIETQKLKPLIETISYKDFVYQACVFNKQLNNYDLYYTSVANNYMWSLDKGDSKNTCHLETRM